MDNEEKLPPVMRYCMKCGAAALRFIGPKVVHCEVCGFDLYLNTAAAVAALITDDQKRLLVVVRAQDPCQGMWDLPGGFADPGESAEQCVRREVKEELGLEVTAARYLCSYPNWYEYGGMRYATMDLGFVCEVEDVAAARAQDEVAEVLFVPLEEIDVVRFGFASVGRIAERYRVDRDTR